MGCSFKRRVKYTFEQCKEVALKYTTYKDFLEKERHIASACKRNGWYYELTKHLKAGNNLSKRGVYLIMFPNGVDCYIGLTWDFSERFNAHLTKTNSSVFHYIKQNNIDKKDVKLIILNDYVEDNKASELERYYIEKYKNDGFNLLNKNRGGTLAKNIIYSNATKEKCKEVLEKIDYDLGVFRTEYKSLYNKCSKNKWFYELIPNYKKAYKKENEYENILKIVKQCKTRNEFKKNYRKFYSFAIKYNFLQKLYDDAGLPTTHTPRKINQIKDGVIIKTYDSIKDACKMNQGYVESTIYNCIRLDINAYGYKWVFL